jgi:hypothetical protein
MSSTHFNMSEQLAQRLLLTEWDKPAALDALRGRCLPHALGHHTTRLCIVSGLRKHLDFALRPEVEELCRMPGQEVFARARNAGLIMHGLLPDAELLRGNEPYCIHYPKLASEHYYRRLATTFTEMRYQVGRACAAAGYSQLYEELNLLPDVCIAEEARDSCQRTAAEGSQRIYDRIMEAPARYNVMDDFKRLIRTDQTSAGACLNGDTQVLSSLRLRIKLANHHYSRRTYPWRYFNITEDLGIGEEDHKVHRLTESEIGLFDAPLPRDLPTVHKELLILAAAWDGNVDRYTRLRRPEIPVPYEIYALVRGVYKSTAMAHWLDRNPDIMQAVYQGLYGYGEPKELRRAIHARRVMNNDVHHLLDADPPVPDDELPYWIWWPTLPSPEVLLELAQKRPAMRHQCVRACMAGGYEKEYSGIMDLHDKDGKSLAVDRHLVYDAKISPEHSFFEPDMILRMKDQGYSDVKDLPLLSDAFLEEVIPWRDADPSGGDPNSMPLIDSCAEIGCDEEDNQHMYENMYATMGDVRRYLSTPSKVRAREYAHFSSLWESATPSDGEDETMERNKDFST